VDGIQAGASKSSAEIGWLIEHAQERSVTVLGGRPSADPAPRH
jgi:hypothetical protein